VTTVVVRQIDHILIRSDAPADLFTLFAEQWQLPVAWPFSSYGTFASGAVHAGNVNLEFIAYGTPKASPNAARAQYHGLALEPDSLDGAAETLDSRGIPHGEIERPHETPGEVQTWSSISLPTLSEGLEVFLCEYSQDVQAFRTMLGTKLSDIHGGALGLVRVEAVVIESDEVRATAEAWTAVIGPRTSSPWSLGAGPAIDLEAGPKPRISRLKLAVEELNTASAAVIAAGASCSPRGEGLVCAGPFGLTLELVQTA
jgi:hypothetical protein